MCFTERCLRIVQSEKSYLAWEHSLAVTLICSGSFAVCTLVLCFRVQGGDGNCTSSDCRESRGHPRAEPAVRSRQNSKTCNWRSLKGLVKLIPVWRAKATQHMLLWEPSCSPWGALGAHRACCGFLLQPGVQGDAAEGTVSLKWQQP